MALVLFVCLSGTLQDLSDLDPVCLVSESALTLTQWDDSRFPWSRGIFSVLRSIRRTGVNRQYRVDVTHTGHRDVSGVLAVPKCWACLRDVRGGGGVGVCL